MQTQAEQAQAEQTQAEQTQAEQAQDVTSEIASLEKDSDLEQKTLQLAQSEAARLHALDEQHVAEINSALDQAALAKASTQLLQTQQENHDLLEKINANEALAKASMDRLLDLQRRNENDIKNKQAELELQQTQESDARALKITEDIQESKANKAKIEELIQQRTNDEQHNEDLVSYILAQLVESEASLDKALEEQFNNELHLDQAKVEQLKAVLAQQTAEQASAETSSQLLQAQKENSELIKQNTENETTNKTTMNRLSDLYKYLEADRNKKQAELEQLQQQKTQESIAAALQIVEDIQSSDANKDKIEELIQQRTSDEQRIQALSAELNDQSMKLSTLLQQKSTNTDTDTDTVSIASTTASTTAPSTIAPTTAPSTSALTTTAPSTTTPSTIAPTTAPSTSALTTTTPSTTTPSTTAIVPSSKTSATNVQTSTFVQPMDDGSNEIIVKIIVPGNSQTFIVAKDGNSTQSTLTQLVKQPPATPLIAPTRTAPEIPTTKEEEEYFNRLGISGGKHKKTKTKNKNKNKHSTKYNRKTRKRIIS